MMRQAASIPGAIVNNRMEKTMSHRAKWILKAMLKDIGKWLATIILIGVIMAGWYGLTTLVGIRDPGQSFELLVGIIFLLLAIIIISGAILEHYLDKYNEQGYLKRSAEPDDWRDHNEAYKQFD